MTFIDTQGRTWSSYHAYQNRGLQLDTGLYPKPLKRAKSTKVRDTQKLKLYAAERVAFKALGMKFDQQDFETLDGCKDVVSGVLNSAWYRTHRVELGMEYRTVGFTMQRGRWVDEFGGLKVVARRGRGSRGGGNKILMARIHWNVPVTLHELAHCLTPHKYAWHGREYARIYLALVTRFISARAGEELKHAFKAAGVKYTPKRQTTVSAATLAALAKGRATLAAKRAAAQQVAA